MTRTKYVRSSKSKSKFSTSTNIKKSVLNTSTESNKEDLGLILIANFKRDFELALDNLKSRLSIYLDQIESNAGNALAVIPEHAKKKTLAEYRTEKSLCASSFKLTSFESASILKNLSSYMNTTEQKKKKQTDEGYLTAGESGNTEFVRPHSRSASSTRQSRLKQRKVAASTRVSRSLSRSQINKTVRIQARNNETPANTMRPPISFGMVTPKVKPNTTLSVLRRPKQGEMAISMQGSPLLVSGVVTESCANVNIPLNDGRVMSLQPCRTMRMSEIPDLDEITRQQLLTLRDNINKVVQLSSTSGN